MNKRHLLTFAGCCLLFLCCLTLPVRADTVAGKGNTTLVTFISEKVLTGTSPISFNSASFGYPSMEEIEASVRKVYHDPRLFLLQRSGSWNISSKGGRYTLTLPYNQEIMDDYGNAKLYYSRAINKIASQADPKWSDAQKVLFVNDYIAQNCRYDTSAGNYDAYTLLRDGRGVCEGYTLLATALLEKLGLRCSYVSSESLNHTWNLVQVDGEWYHLDATWNDPAPDRPGHAGHRYFLMSTETLRSMGSGEHFKAADWEYGRDVQCTSKRFENQVYSEAVSPFVLLDKQWYYVSADGLNRWDGVSEKGEMILSFPALFRELYPTYSFQGYASCSGLFERNGLLFFNTSFNVLVWDPATGNTQSLVDALNGGNIGGCALYEDSKVLFTLQRSGTSTSYYQDIPPELLDPSAENAKQQAAIQPITGVGGFTDVQEGDWFAESVLWAVGRGITTGTTPTAFSPDQRCTRAQILTFLWRAEGSPSVSPATGFSDVTDQDYYYPAANWARYWGLIRSSRLDGGAPCSREDTVLLLWQLAGMPAVESAARFTDVDAGSALGAAVSWALAKGVTSGTSETTFSPEQICTRAQIVTFLNRFYAA